MTLMRIEPNRLDGAAQPDESADAATLLDVPYLDFRDVVARCEPFSVRRNCESGNRLVGIDNSALDLVVQKNGDAALFGDEMNRIFDLSRRSVAG